MKLSIIDIGSKSIKHYIFDVKNNAKNVLHYKRYSEASLGEADEITQEAADRCLTILGGCKSLNDENGVDRCMLFGTEILRKASNASSFIGSVEGLFGVGVKVLSHEVEAEYLYKGFVDIVPEKHGFGAVNIGGGSTEFIAGDKTKMQAIANIPLGVKFLREKFYRDGMDWQAMDEFLFENVNPEIEVDSLFVTGVLDFLSVIAPKMEFSFSDCQFAGHPISMSLEYYKEILDKLRKTPIEILWSYYEKDPHYADNFAIGQSVYYAIAMKIGAKQIIPSNNDLTDGAIHDLLKK